MKKEHNSRAITLIALVITIIILLILAGISIAYLNGENGLITKSKLAKFAEEMTKIQENVELKKHVNAMNILETETETKLFDNLLKDNNQIEIKDTLKKEILYVRDGNPSDKSPSDYDVDDFNLDNDIYIIDKETGDKKENTYIYDQRTNVVFKISPTKIGNKIYHSYTVAKIGKGGTDEEKNLIIKDEAEAVTVDEITYYEPNLKGFNAKNTQVVYYYLNEANSGDSNNFKLEQTKPVEEYVAEDRNTRYKMTVDNNDYTFHNYKRKCWANIKTTSNGLEAWWVWIPRYAYKIESDNSMSIIYVNLSGKQFDGTDLPEGYDVHPAFTVGGQQLKGIWMSKYEASYTVQVPIEGVLPPDMTGFDANNTYIELYDATNAAPTAAVKLADANLSTINQDKKWYDYKNKKWANIKTTAHGLEAWWVWIPRYAYRIEADNSMDIIYVDTNNKPLNKEVFESGKLPEDYTVHPAFTVDGKQLQGIWMSKYEASYTAQVGSEQVEAPDMTGFNQEYTYIELYDATNAAPTAAVKLAEANLSTINQDKKWYDYKNKKWANIKTIANGLEAWWVWIPRYAYRIEADNSMDIIFVGTDNKPLDTENYPNGLPEGYDVHPAFTVEGQQLKGIWMSKYEASNKE